ncbi:MAG: hypothetical protein EXQ88_01240 [Alphaproteobacteria bacterium]|nr:hypothetical protein [Alphaproteobacteria bacterium]
MRGELLVGAQIEIAFGFLAFAVERFKAAEQVVEVAGFADQCFDALLGGILRRARFAQEQHLARGKLGQTRTLAFELRAGRRQRDAALGLHMLIGGELGDRAA